MGINGYFLRHFGLSFGQFKYAVTVKDTDQELAQWFLNQLGVNSQTIAEWNAFALETGDSGLSRFLRAPCDQVDSLFQVYSPSREQSL
jgi:hypothetical protein